MENKNLTLSAQKPGYGYELALRLACERLAGIGDIEQQCRHSDAKCLGRVVAIEFLNRHYTIAPATGVVSVEGGQEDVPIREKLLILHYFLTARGTPLSGRLITYKDLPEGTVYFPTFSKRAIKPLVDNFGGEPQRLPEAALALGGHKADFGDAATTISAFSRVPITLVLWRGDEEFPPEGNILFDSTVTDYLSVEDINVVCETIAWKLVRLQKTGGGDPDRN
ncbi:MAG: DUF3786 domain-containing protein [Chloroflexota bacterium]